MHELVRQFRAAQAAREDGVPGRGGRYPESQRLLALRYCDEARSGGVTLKAAAAHLGVHADTLDDWCRKRSVGLVPAITGVRVVDDAPRKASHITVHLPGGVALSGLTLDDALELAARVS
jgi:hypothetical protein